MGSGGCGRLGTAALRAARAGWAVFPVRPGDKTPAVTHWENTATRDVNQIRAWWAARPYNIGIPTGRAGLVVLDLDVARHGASGSDPRPGIEVLLALAIDAGEPAPLDTFTVATPSGGRHLYFEAPRGIELRNSQSRLGPHIDTRARGGFVVGPGSVRPDGCYRIVHDTQPADLPEWITTRLTPPALPPPIPVPTSTLGSPRGRAYVRAAVAGECAAVTAARVGQRHTVLLRAATRIGRWVGSGALTETEAHAMLTEAAGGFVGIAQYTVRQIDRDIRDGLRYGSRFPRHIGREPRLAQRPEGCRNRDLGR